jgi:intracellular multiplication protein IcmP
MAQQQAQQGGGTDSGMGPVWITVLLFVTFYLIWALARAQIVKFVFFFNLLQAKLVVLFLGPGVLDIDINWMSTVDPGSVEWDQLVASTMHIGSYVRYPFCFLLAVLSLVLFQSDVTRKFRRAHNMKTLRAQEQKNWTCIMPVINEDLAKTDISTGPWAMALNPMEFARQNNLLKKEDPLLDAKPGTKKNPGEQWTAGIRKVEAKRIFTMQLGPVWEGFDKAPPQARALAAVFMARMNRDRQGASMILDTLVKTAVQQGKPNYDIANETLLKHQGIEMVQELLSQHAYLLTVMASLLQASRQDGVVPSSEFLWLKLFDRRLWYMLNCVGRQTPYAEVAGPFAHWRAEQVLGRRSLVPMVDEAIRALEIAVKEVKLSPKELRGLTP